mgnify:CR=1 FL=1
MSKNIQMWIEKINQIHLPRYEELPNIDLYLDQVITYVNNAIKDVFILNSQLDEDVVTPSMINNYVKNKIMIPPQKKKYKRTHLAFIITITILKHVGSLSDVSLGIVNLKNVLGTSLAYDTFIEFIEKSLKASASELNHTPDPTYYMMPVSLDLLPLKTATLAFTSIMLTRYLFSIQTKN